MQAEFLKDKTGADTVLLVDGKKAAIIISADKCVDRFEKVGNGIFRWIRESLNPTDEMNMEIKACYKPIHTVIPSVSYDGNRWGTDHEYKGYSYDGKPYLFAYHRCAVRAGSASEGESVSLALYAENDEICSCAMVVDDDSVKHSIIWPEQESPRSMGARYWASSYKIEMQPKNIFKAYICIGKKGESETALKTMLKNAWEQSKHEVKAWYTPEKTWELGVKYAKTLWTKEQNGFEGFDIGLFWNSDQKEWGKNEDNKYEIGWCGQNASYAVSLIYDYIKNKDEDSLKKGIGVLDSWLNHAKSPEGHILTHYSPLKPRVIDACNLGTYALQLFKAYDVLKSINIDGKRFYDTALKICRFVLERQNEDGSLAKSWNQDGTVDQPEGTIGAFMIPPMLEAYKREGDAKYLKAAILCYSYYYGEFNEEGYTTAGALDTYCIDKESAMPLLKAGLMLFEITGDTKYLKCAQEAGLYLATWQWHHSVEYPEGSILNQIGFDTFGSTSVSTAHHHMDAYALYYFHDYINLGKLLCQQQWSERAKAIWNNATQGISDGSLIINGLMRPEGSQDEGFMHTRWKQEKSSYFGVSQWLVAWPGALRLEALRELNDWNFLNKKKNL